MKKRLLSLLLTAVLCLGLFPVPVSAARDISVEEALAADLKQLGLFQGVSDTDFDLGRAPSRTEAVVMLIRFLGKESETAGGRWTHPFTDVPDWADRYVGYAYQKGLTNGVGDTQFGASAPAGSNMYLTFVLRALGYSDAGGADFSWEDPYALAARLGILPQGTNTDDFWRADLVRVSYAALPVKLKGSDKALYETLIDAGAFTPAQYGAVYDPSALQGQAPADKTLLTAEQISAKCAPAVFYVEIYGLNGALTGSGSGFFISGNGLAVTNYHVAANSSHLVITTTDGKTYSDVKILDGDRKNDLALLKVAGSGFPYLELADSSQVVQGQKVYAIGNPLGLTNTMSEGIVSNSRRAVDGREYIQTSAPIDHGSSGGALLNEAGKVIGVTSAGYVSTANLNLAVPSNFIQSLDKSDDSGSGLVLWQRTFYPGFDHAYDFGAFSGVTLMSELWTPTICYSEYDAFDFYAAGGESEGAHYALTLLAYQQALLNEGFVPDEVVDDLFGWYDLPTESVYFSADLSGTKTITVIALKETQYYAEVPGLPDFGWFIGIESPAAAPLNSALTYQYKWSNLFGSYDDFDLWLGLYFDLLEEEGFVQTYVDSTAASFVGNGLSVVFMVDGASFWVAAAPLAGG